jgi:hypothetical protein
VGDGFWNTQCSIRSSTTPGGVNDDDAIFIEEKAADGILAQVPSRSEFCDCIVALAKGSCSEEYAHSG